MFNKLLPASLIAVGLALVAAGSVALAVGVSDKGSSRDDLINRVAAELGMDPQTVSDALDQAQSEELKQRLDDTLAQMVQAGTITQEQSDAASAWLDARPAAADKLLFNGKLLPLAFSGKVPFAIPGLQAAPNGAGLGDATLINRMAEILGVDAQALKDAIGNAQSAQAKDQRTAALNSFVDSLVQQGDITETEGADIKAWLADMPDWILDTPLLFAGKPALAMPGGPFNFQVVPPDPNSAAPNAAPNGSGQFHFFYNGPKGQFNFDGTPGQLPDDLQGLLNQFNNGFGFGDGLQQLPPSIPAQPDQTPEAQSTAVAQNA